jgi:N-acetyl-alpha-D-muramate 1-phosphate uridylyltransferase
MKAMIFAAGLGTRLGSLTEDKPKAMVEVNGRPMLEHVVEYLTSYGIRDIVVNVHHYGWLIFDFLKQKNNFGIHIEISDESNELLDTGGGLIKAAHFFADGKPFVAHNVDVLSKTNLNEVLKVHQQKEALATLVVKQRSTSRYLLCDAPGNIAGWRNVKTGEEILARSSEEYAEVAFSGIQIIDPKLFACNRLSGKFSLTQMYLELAKSETIASYMDKGVWFDLGRPENITEAETTFFD